MNNQTLQKWLLESPEDSDQWMLDGLNIGLNYLGMENGIISRINHRDYIIQQASSKHEALFAPGDLFEINNTYCEAVVRQHRSISFIHAGNIPEMRLHPVYQSMQMETYLGTPIIDNGTAVIGTLSFSSQQVRAKEFTTQEIDFVETMANKLAEVLTQ